MAASKRPRIDGMLSTSSISYAKELERSLLGKSIRILLHLAEIIYNVC